MLVGVLVKYILAKEASGSAYFDLAKLRHVRACALLIGDCHQCPWTSISYTHKDPSLEAILVVIK